MPTSRWAAGLLCLAAIYLPSLLPLVGVLPFWDGLRRQTAGPRRPARHQCGRGHFALALGAFVLLAAWRVPPWLVVALGVVATFVRDGVL